MSAVMPSLNSAPSTWTPGADATPAQLIQFQVQLSNVQEIMKGMISGPQGVAAAANFR